VTQRGGARLSIGRVVPSRRSERQLPDYLGPVGVERRVGGGGGTVVVVWGGKVIAGATTLGWVVVGRTVVVG
jgi:hypothetical protein